MWSAIKMYTVFLVLGVPASLIGIPWSALSRDFQLMYRWGMVACAAGVRAAGIRVIVEGRENLPVNESCIFMCNHCSNVDPPIVLPVLPGRSSVFLKKALMKIPLLGTAMRMGKYIPVSRGHSREEAMASVRAAKDALESGLNVFVFPEGTRSPDGTLGQFRKGAFFLAADTGAPIVPMLVLGTRAIQPKGTLKISPGVATVRFLPAVRPEAFASREELLLAVRESMLEALGESPA
jgi:1-acyl-sn-glycerol-3-phosphate acyltransferase